MELLAEKEEEVRQCQIKYEDAMKYKQVSIYLDTFSFLFIKAMFYRLSMMMQ